MTAFEAQCGEAAAFWSKLDKTAPNGCWEWTRAVKSNGYGVVWMGGRCHHTHRVAYALAVGPLTEGLDVRHACDNRKCCNPAHLSLGTRKQNMRDAVDRGRSARGERAGMAKLSERDVKTILAAIARGHVQREIARDFGVSEACVSSIKTGGSWTHIERMPA